jgi:endonuclease YncB( thermonuclease family)
MPTASRPPFLDPTRCALARAALLLLAVSLAAACAPAGTASPGATPASGPTSHGGVAATATAEPSAARTAQGGLAPAGETETASVVRVVDGDTIIIDRGRGDERLRYIGVNAPESVKPDTPVEFMGKEASAANRALVEGAEVVLERDVSDRDQYDRLLRYVWIRDGDAWVFVNLELVREGYAHATTYPPDVRWTDTLRAAERAARKAGLGLWGPATQKP